jgi:hypothetical protein
LQIFLMLAAPIYWCKMVSSTNALVRHKAIEMLAAHCLFSRQLPIQSAIANRKGNRFNTRWRRN